MSPKFIDFKTKTPNPNVKDVFDVSVIETHQLKNEVLLVDVRRPDEWVGEYGHISSAELITLDTLPQKLNELKKDRTIVFVCRSGARSAQASSFALENGFTSVYNMKGGMIAWTEAQLPSIEKNSGI